MSVGARSRSEISQHTDVKSLIAEADMHIATTVNSLGPANGRLRAAWSRGEGVDERFRLVVQMRDALAHLDKAREVTEHMSLKREERR